MWFSGKNHENVFVPRLDSVTGSYRIVCLPCPSVGDSRPFVTDWVQVTAEQMIASDRYGQVTASDRFREIQDTLSLHALWKFS